MIHSLSRRSGLGYFLAGAKLIVQPGLRQFVLLPLLANIILFSLALWAAVYQIGNLNHWLENGLPHWLSWLSWLIWPLAILALLLCMAILFGTLANWIAAPFNGLLAERVEQHLTGQALPDTSLTALIKDLPRIFKREWLKFKYYLPKALGCLVLFFIPVLGQTLAPVLWFVFGAWMMSIQYCDYPFDNHKIPFNTMRQALGRQRISSLGFGAVVTLFATVPLLNLVVMPIAVCGATVMWVEQHRTTLLGDR